MRGFPRFELIKHHCPSCDMPLDAATGVSSDKGPRPDDVTVCLYCGAVMVFTADLSYREPTDKERAEFDCDPRIQKLRRAVNSIRRSTNQ